MYDNHKLFIFLLFSYAPNIIIAPNVIITPNIITAPNVITAPNIILPVDFNSC